MPFTLQMIPINILRNTISKLCLGFVHETIQLENVSLCQSKKVMTFLLDFDGLPQMINLIVEIQF